jgi:hypothetical protein
MSGRKESPVVSGTSVLANPQDPGGRPMEVQHVDDAKRIYREGETRTKEAVRNVDGHQVSDDIGNTGDEIRKDLGNAGDDLRSAGDHAADDARHARDEAGNR